MIYSKDVRQVCPGILLIKVVVWLTVEWHFSATLLSPSTYLTLSWAVPGSVPVYITGLRTNKMTHYWPCNLKRSVVLLHHICSYSANCNFCPPLSLDEKNDVGSGSQVQPSKAHDTQDHDQLEALVSVLWHRVAGILQYGFETHAPIVPRMEVSHMFHQEGRREDDLYDRLDRFQRRRV